MSGGSATGFARGGFELPRTGVFEAVEGGRIEIAAGQFSGTFGPPAPLAGLHIRFGRRGRLGQNQPDTGQRQTDDVVHEAPETNKGEIRVESQKEGSRQITFTRVNGQQATARVIALCY